MENNKEIIHESEVKELIIELRGEKVLIDRDVAKLYGVETRYPEMEKEILPILKEFNIDKPNLPMEQDVVEYAEKIKNTKTEEIKQELINYIETAF